MAMNGHVKAPEKARDILQRSLPHAPRKARLKESTKKTPGVESGGGDFEPNRNLHRQTTIREEDIGKYYPNYRKPGGATGSPAETPEHGSRKADQEPEPRIDYERYARLKLPVKKLRLPGQNEPQYLLVPESSNPAMPAPEAPEIDMRSYSYRLIGRTYFCEEQYAKAAEALELAVKLSLEWPDANYDYSQYCALAGKRDECLSWLAKAILAKPIFYYLAQKEISFDPLRQDVEALLRDVKKRASDKAGALVSEAEAHLRQAQEAVRDAEETMAKARQKEGLAPRNLLKPAESCLKDSREKLASADYRQVLDSQIMAAQATAEARQARTAADAAANGATAERRAVLSEQAHSAKGKILGWTFKGFFLGMSAGAIVAVTVGEFGHIEDQDSGPIIYGCVLAGGVLGALAGFLWVYSSYRRSQSELKVLSDRAETRTKKG